MTYGEAENPEEVIKKILEISSKEVIMEKTT